jgi:CheY-like chemotaxis protein
LKDDVNNGMLGHATDSNTQTLPGTHLISRPALLQYLQQKRVLLVDDVSLARKLCRKVLQSSFGSIDEADNGLQAVELFRSAEAQLKPFHIILMDFMMPIMNGLEATKIIRSESKHPVVIIGVTGNGLKTDIDLFISAGADHVLTKPIDVEQLMQVLAGTGWL